MPNSVLSVLLLVITLGLLAGFVQAYFKLRQLKRKLRDYSRFSSKEEIERHLDSNIHIKRNELSSLEGQKQNLKAQVDKLKQQLRGLEAKIYLQSLEPHESYYDLISSEDCLTQLEDNKKEQELLKRNGRAYICRTNSMVSKKIVKNLLELIKLAFENQCKFTLREVKHNNVATLERKVVTAFEKINKLIAVANCEISREYLDLKIRQIHLVKYELEEEKQKKEQQQELQRQKRKMEDERNKSEKARREIEEAEERERLHQQELDKIRQEVQQVEGEKRKQLELRIQQLNQQVINDQQDIEDATLRYRRVKDGHIYVVSNFGSFARTDIYRIFMTKREDEYDYIRAINRSVPFPFDIHFKIYSEEASDTIAYLHQQFQDRRVNLDNERRDFFQVPLDEIEQVIEEIRQEKGGIRILECVRQPQNSEYLRSLSLERKRQQK